jgi:pimeloyl-ACP methyl ester carboxylesterase
MSASAGTARVVLVHGAWADGSSWNDVTGPLLSKGFDVVAAPIPLTSLSDDVAALDRTLERIARPAVLVAHAYAGAVIGATTGNAYVEGLSDGWDPIRAYWQDPSAARRAALRSFLAPQTTIWQYTHGVADTSLVSPDGYSLDNFYLTRPGADEVQLDLLGDYKTNVAMYPEFQGYFRRFKPPLLAIWGKNDPFFLPAGAEAFKRDIPAADIRFFDTGHFALETHCDEMASAIRAFLELRQVNTSTLSDPGRRCSTTHE